MISKLCLMNNQYEEGLNYAALAVELISSIDCDDLMPPYKWINSLGDKAILEIYKRSCNIENQGGVFLGLYKKYNHDTSSFEQTMASQAREQRKLAVRKMKIKASMNTETY